jgi:threonine dehydrogenase-like Zn-dependent dehydrogenase
MKAAVLVAPGKLEIREIPNKENFDSNLLHYKLASVRGTYGSTLYQNRLAMEMIASGFTEKLCDSRYPLERISEAFERAGEGQALKIVIEA